MTFTESIKESLEIVKLNREAYRRTAENPETFTWALVITAIAGVSSGLGPGMIGSAGFVWLPIAALAGLFIGVGIMHLLAMLFGGQGDFMGFVKVCGFGRIVGWAGVIPFVGGLVQLWMLPIVFIALQEHHKLDTAKAVIVLLIPTVVFGLLAIIMGAFIGAAILGGAFLGGH
ncbi:MAG: YIP1 family protein [Candidatus Eisenbacteria bacterium]|uniref:YIP1 family protein n=1 Tax=Eiseniibacteriota bacterium TaxID=2212470 RepID=A0A948RWU1_UNCEI|nr:YIP1 family protein [Candidatus Eisenbacteria bacterium]MBU1947771.1 YIP1 family protein [Candidatus Eisenbacteria bacterium]MBU2691079.1 YIP1 family protein [Candidatus Eisenbacteria bacterium]